MPITRLERHTQKYAPVAADAWPASPATCPLAASVPPPGGRSHGLLPPAAPAPRSLSEATKRLAARRILSRVSEAYGRMLLLDGLFQADGHPGNILVMKGGCPL